MLGASRTSGVGFDGGRWSSISRWVLFSRLRDEGCGFYFGVFGHVDFLAMVSAKCEG